MDNEIIELPDGFNGHTMKFYRNPVEIWADGTMKLKCAEPGKEFIFCWARISDVRRQPLDGNERHY